MAEVTGKDQYGNAYDADTSRDYDVQTETPVATIEIDQPFVDGVLNQDESKVEQTITSSVGGAAQVGDAVVVTIGGKEYPATVKGGNQAWKTQWYGAQRFFDWLESRAYKMHVRVLLSKYRSYTTCPAFAGSRLKMGT
ncbi:excinuclease ABC subunit [Alcaligenes faecalis subsp. faecalis NCIB 8687]|nr:excinuclease ABC subunit [Alcaligenes faecalis subsp. faecalis NCIB 8687]